MNFTLEKLSEARNAGIPDDVIWRTAIKADERFAQAKEKNIPLESAFRAFQKSQAAKPAEPEPEQPFFALEDAVSAIGTIPEALAVGVPAAFKRLVTGTAMPEESEVIERDIAFQERMQREQEDRQAAGKSSVVGEAIRGATPSLGSTIGSGGAAVAGGFLGLLGGPAAKVTVPAGIATASGLASYRMAASDLLYRSFRELEKSKGSPLTDEEKAKAYEVFLPLAQESGLWEAGPEAVSNVLLAGAGKFIFGFGKPVADRIVKDSIGRVTNQLGKKIAAGTGALAGELAGETTTAVGQFPAQAKAEQFIRTGTTEGAPTEYPGGVVQAFKDVTPSTIALTAGLGLVGGGAKLTTMPFQRQKSPEQIEEDNINLDAEREADNLLIPDNDAESKSIKAQIDSERADLVVKKELYNSLPEGDKARAVLATEIKEYEGRITELDNTLKQRLGLSVTITPVEQRQIELAKQIAAPVEPAPTTPAPLPEAAPAPITPAEEAKPKAPPKYSPEGLAALTDAELASEEQSLALSVNREAVTDPQSELASLYQGALDLVRAEKSRREAATVTETPAVTPAPVSETITPAVEAAPVVPSPTPVTTPPVTKAVTPAPAAPAAPAPVGISVGNRIKLGKSPQTYTVEQIIPQSETERGLGEQFYSVKNERTGEVQTVEAKDLKPVLARVRRGEKGGVLFLTREDFIQAGQNIYEAGMEFGAWAKQMIQRFGDAVRQFLADVWEAVSGFPAKLEEMAGYLPGKGERGAVTFGRGEEPPNKPAAEGKATAKAEGGARAEIAALPYGKEKTTPIGINRKTEEIVQKQIFNGASEVSPEKTAEAYDLIDRLLDPKTGGKYADEVNEITRSQMSENEKRQVDETIGAVKLGNELFKYAVNLAAKGDLRMLQYLFEYGNDLATSGTATISTDARNLQARANLASWVRRAAEAQKKGVVNAIAIRIFGPGVTKEQMDSIIEAVNKVNKTKTQEVDKVYDDLEATGKAGGVDILGAVQKAMEKASLESRDPWVMALEVLKGMEGFQKFTYEKPTQNIKSILQGTPFAKSLANFRKKMEETGGGGLNTTFWKTLSDQENKLGPLGEVDMAINRNLGSIVKDTLIRLGLKGEPTDTKMTLIEQVANILANNDLSNAKMLQADKMISDEIDRRESGALKQAGDNQELKDIIEAEYSALRQAWDEAMSRQLDIPISDATLRRLISNRIRESKTSLNEITDIIVNDSALGNARKEGIVTSIIQQLDGLTPEGDTKKDYTKLRQALVTQFDQMIENSKLKKRMGTALRNLKKESKEDQQAERMIDKLADLQSDVQTWPKTKENKVRDIVNEDLRQKLDLSLKVANKIKPAWKGVLRQKLVDAGVNQDTAERLTEIVWRQHEINYLNRKMKEVETAVTRGSLAPIVEAIKNTPLSQQQDPKWKRKVAFDYLKNAGLDTATANRLADLMDVTLQKVFVQAQEKAFKDIVSKQAKDLNSRRGMERFLKAIRAGALDPEKNMTSELAAQNGWTGFTSEQVAKLNELDTIVSDPDTLDLQRATAFKEIQDIIKTSKLDPTVKEVLSAYYTAQALNGIPTTSVNFFSAVAFSMRNAMTDAIRLAATNPAALPAAFDTFISSWKTYGSEVLFSFKNNVQRRGTVEYLSDDDALLRLYNKGKRQWKEGKRAEGFKNMLFGMMEYVGRWLKALDEGAVSVLEQQGLTRYAMEAMKQAGVSSKDARAAANSVLQQKEMFIVNSIAKGMNKTEAKALSDDVFRGAWVEALSDMKLDSQEVLDSALNDALSVIGRVNNTFDQLRQEQRNLRDNGFVSSYPIGLLERLSEAMNSPNATEGQRVFYRMVFGFAIVPARVMREAAWYSPYGGVRFALNWWAKKRGAALPYAQSLGTDLQFRQRMADTIAGSIVLGAALALGSASVDDPEDEKMFKIVVTGNGPQRKLDPQFYDTWTKKYSRNALHVFIGKTKLKINIERGFEAFAIPFMLAGAMDDWKIRKRFEQSKKTPADLSDASMILGSAFLSFSRRGPFAAYMDGIASSKNSDDLLSSATSFFTFTGKTFVPIVGTSLARNISDFVSDPVDRTSMEGALWANTPVIGPMMGTKSMNALGETTGAGELSDRFYKLGMPIVFKLPNTPEQNKLRDLIIEKGQGPDIPTRYDARRTMGFELTDKQFEKYVTVYGQTMKEKMLAGYDSLKAKEPTKFVTSLQKYQETARNRAKTAVNNMDKNP